MIKKKVRSGMLLECCWFQRSQHVLQVAWRQWIIQNAVSGSYSPVNPLHAVTQFFSYMHLYTQTYRYLNMYDSIATLFFLLNNTLSCANKSSVDLVLQACYGL